MGEGAVRLQLVADLGIQGLGVLLLGGQLDVGEPVGVGEVVRVDVAVSVVAPSTASPTHRRQMSRSPRRSPPGTITAAGRPHTEHGVATAIPVRRCGATTPVVALYSTPEGRLASTPIRRASGCAPDRHGADLVQLDVVQLPDVAAAPRLDRPEADRECGFLLEELDHL